VLLSVQFHDWALSTPHTSAATMGTRIMGSFMRGTLARNERVVSPPLSIVGPRSCACHRQVDHALPCARGSLLRQRGVASALHVLLFVEVVCEDLLDVFAGANDACPWPCLCVGARLATRAAGVSERCGLLPRATFPGLARTITTWLLPTTSSVLPMTMAAVPSSMPMPSTVNTLRRRIFLKFRIERRRRFNKIMINF